MTDYITATLAKAEAGGRPSGRTGRLSSAPRAACPSSGRQAAGRFPRAARQPRFSRRPFRNPPPAQARFVLDRLVVVKLNGGLGTSMGLSRPKSLLPVKNGPQLPGHSGNSGLGSARASRGASPVAAHEFGNYPLPTLELLGRYPTLQDPALPLDFLQGREPKLPGRRLPAGVVACRPEVWNGVRGARRPLHGAFRIRNAAGAAGRRSAVVLRFQRRQPGGASRPANRSLDCLRARSVRDGGCPRDASRSQGGHLARHDGRIVLRETAQVPEGDASFGDIERWRFYNTNNLWIDLQALSRLQESDPAAPTLP